MDTVEYFGPDNRYQQYRYLSEGTFGKVYACFDTTTGKKVVCKWIKKKTDYLDTIDIEIRNLLYVRDVVKHEGCISMIDHFEHGDYVCIVFPRMDLSLYDSSRYTPFTYWGYPKVKSIAYQLLQAVNALHSKKMIHTDLKVENILFTDSTETRIALIDFGGSCLPDDYHAPKITTCYYRAPEVVLGLPWNEAADLWSVGVILFEIFTELILFDSLDDTDKHLAMMETVLGTIPSNMQNERYINYKKKSHMYSYKYPKIDSYFTDETRSYGDLIGKLLIFDPAKRSSAEELLNHPLFDELRNSDEIKNVDLGIDI